VQRWAASCDDAGGVGVVESGEFFLSFFIRSGARYGPFFIFVRIMLELDCKAFRIVSLQNGKFKVDLMLESERVEFEAKCTIFCLFLALTASIFSLFV